MSVLPLSESDKRDSSVHIERESAAYILGRTNHRRKAGVTVIWNDIEGDTEYIRAPGHHPVSSAELIRDTNIKKRRSEIRIDHKPGRHITYLDTLNLALRRSKIQLRLEVKQEEKKGELIKTFTEVTIKIGDKAEQRIEGAIDVDQKVWREKGFYAALEEGIQEEVLTTRREKGKEAAIEKRKKFQVIKGALKKALKEAAQEKLKNIKPYPLIHLHRDTIEARYSPNGHYKNVLEVKTDDCHWETVLSHLRGAYTQLEIEDQIGEQSLHASELKRLMGRVSSKISPTTDSKEDPAMRKLEGYLLPQGSSREVRKRVESNRQILEKLLDPLEFLQVNARLAGLQAGSISTPVASGTYKGKASIPELKKAA